MQSSRFPKSSSTASNKDTSVTASRDSQLELAAGQRQQGSFVSLSTTAYPPESTRISATYHQQDELRLLSDSNISDISSSQADPFEILATHPTVTFDDEAVTTGIAGGPNLPSDHYQAERSPDPTDTKKWIMVDKSQERPYKCGFPGCDKNYKYKSHLVRHFIMHTSVSKYRCTYPECVGKKYYRDRSMLKRHIAAKHTRDKKHLQCDRCSKRFTHKRDLNYHRRHGHSTMSKKPPDPQSVSGLSYAASTSTVTSRFSQPESAAEQRQQGSFVDLSETVHTPEPTLIPATYYQQDELRLLSDISVSDIISSQFDPFELLEPHQTVTFEDQDQDQEQPDEFPLPFDELLWPVDDFDPMAREEQSPDPTDKWIINSGDETKRFQCGYEGCGKKYVRKTSLRRHFVSHTGDSRFRCYSGDCTGTVKYPNKRALAQHIRTNHTLERPFGCDICDKRFKLAHHLRYHRVYVHSPKTENKSPKLQSVSKSSSAATAAITASTSTITSGVSQPELAAGQRQQGSYIGISTTIDTPESMQMLKDYHQQAGLRPSTEVCAVPIQGDPFEALATHPTATFDDEAVTTRIAGAPNLPSDQYQAEQSPDLTDKWIIVDKSPGKLYKCGYPGCDKGYTRRSYLIAHLLKHTGKSKFKCPYPECAGNEYFRDSAALKRHIATKHTLDKPFQCSRCNKRFTRKENLKYHREHVHYLKNEQESPERKRK